MAEQEQNSTEAQQDQAPQQAAPETAAAAPEVAAASPVEAAPAPAPTPAPAPQQQAPQARHGGGGRGRPGGRGGPRQSRRQGSDDDGSGIESSVVRIYRCAKVVKGGRTFSFGALVVAGDRRGNVGIGYGKANEVPPSVEKATKEARKSMFKVNLKGGTIPHAVRGVSGSSTVVLVPARPGTGVKAGKSVRPCLELAGLTDILSKAYGSTSPKNLVKATIAALRRLQSKEQVERTRGVQLPVGAGDLD